MQKMAGSGGVVCSWRTVIPDCLLWTTDKCGSILTNRRDAEEVVFPQKVREKGVDLMGAAQLKER